MIKRYIVFTIFTLWLPASATAALLQLEYSGTFSADSTLGGVAFGVDTPYTYTAVFDSLADSSPFNDEGIFDTVVTFNISGHGTFTSDPAGDVNVQLFTQANFLAGIGNSGTTQGFVGVFSTATPVFDADASIPSILSGFLGSDAAGPYTIPLSGGAGDLAVVNVVNGPSAVISAVVPVPAAVWLFSSGLLGLVGLAKRKQQNSGQIRVATNTSQYRDLAPVFPRD